jgi:hydroxymethylglutaryl-CoA reductase (NADPH)
MFIATGQDVANVAESSAGILYSELTAAGERLLTIPPLMVATYGDGTGLATQRKCLGMLARYGKGKVNRPTEIIAGLTLAGEISCGRGHLFFRLGFEP